jgi:YgiT-type zinc finger domain-containing protein
MKSDVEACANCGKSGVIHRKISRSYGRGRDLLVIEGVPIVVCPHCGDAYLTADSLRHLEEIRKRRRAIAIPRSVAVANFQASSRP